MANQPAWMVSREQSIAKNNALGKEMDIKNRRALITQIDTESVMGKELVSIAAVNLMETINRLLIGLSWLRT